MTKQRQQLGAICTYVVVVSPNRYILDPSYGSYTYDKAIAHLWLSQDEAIKYAARGVGWTVERARP